MKKMTPEKAKAILKANNIEVEGNLLLPNMNNFEIFEALLSAGANPDYFITRFNVPILSFTFSRRDYKAFLLLLKYGANPNVPSSTSYTNDNIIFETLFDSQRSGYLKALIKAKVDLNLFHPESGDTMLMRMIKINHFSTETLQILLENGADPNIPNKNGFTIYDLIENGEVVLRKPDLLLLKQFQTGAEKPTVLKKTIEPFSELPIFKTNFYHDLYSWRGIKVISKTKDCLIVRMYNLQQYHNDFPRTHSHALNIVFSLLEKAQTTSEWQKFAAVFDFKQDHLTAARRLIHSFEVSDFQNILYNESLWEEHKRYEFDENSSPNVLNSLMQATMTIRVNEAELLETIEPETSIKIPEYSISPFWLRQNKATSSFYALYISEGGKWMAHEGQIGSEGVRKPVKGISKGYYKLANERAEAVTFEKAKDGYELIYRSFDTRYNLEEEIEEQLRQAKKDENKSDASEVAVEYIQNKEIEKLKFLLESGIHPDSLKDKYGDSVLEKVADIWSPDLVDLEMFKLLLHYGADPNQGEGHPLLQAISSHSKGEIKDEMVRCLVNAGADIDAISNHPGYFKSSALQSACYGGVLWFVEFLLEKGADVHYQDTKGLTALNYAVEANRNAVEIIAILLKYGADKNDLLKLNSKGSTSFELAKTPETILKIASLGIDINMKNGSDFPAIWNAAEYASPELFETYLNLEAEVDIHNIIHRITNRMNHIGGREIIESHMKKFRMLYDRGYEISPSSSNTFDWVYESYKNRKKITKYEEQALVGLWEMGCRPRSLTAFQEYVEKVHSAQLQFKINELKMNQ